MPAKISALFRNLVGCSLALFFTMACKVQSSYSSSGLGHDVCGYLDQGTENLSFDLGISERRLARLGYSDPHITIPIEYVNPAHVSRIKNNSLGGSFSVTVRVSDFTPYTIFEIREGIKQKVRPYARVSLRPIGISRASLRWSISDREYEDLDKTFKLRSPVEGLNGLIELEANFNGKDVFIASDGRDIIDMITCSDILEVKKHADPKSILPINESCTHLFDAGPIDVSITYDRELLPLWSSIRQDAKGFVNCIIK